MFNYIYLARESTTLYSKQYGGRGGSPRESVGEKDDSEREKQDLEENKDDDSDEDTDDSDDVDAMLG